MSDDANKDITRALAAMGSDALAYRTFARTAPAAVRTPANASPPAAGAAALAVAAEPGNTLAQFRLLAAALPEARDIVLTAQPRHMVESVRQEAPAAEPPVATPPVAERAVEPVMAFAAPPAAAPAPIYAPAPPAPAPAPSPFWGRPVEAPFQQARPQPAPASPFFHAPAPAPAYAPAYAPAPAQHANQHAAGDRSLADMFRNLAQPGPAAVPVAGSSLGAMFRRL